MKIHISLFIILNLLDYILTRVALNLGGIEANPIANVFIKFNLLWLYKAMMVLGVIYLISVLAKKRGKRRAMRFYKIGNVILLFVVIWNVVIAAMLQFNYLKYINF